MKKLSLGAFAAAGLLAGSFATGASAADLGGNCCADLEERIAELEATTARKGNRKVSLTISGFVAQQIIHWDDGFEDNTYITDTGSVSIGTHVAFTGQATIVPGWTAGYVIKIEVINVDSLLVSQSTDEGLLGGGNAQAIVANQSNDSVAVESAYWFIKSDKHGRLSLGQQSSAADNQAILPDGSGSLVQANYVLYDVNAFLVRDSAGNLSGSTFGNFADCAPLNGSGGVAGDCDGYPGNHIRYDTPTFAGFSASASWGEDDTWAVSGRYSGEHHGIKIALAAAYNASKDENGPAGLNQTAFANVQGGFDAAAFQIGGYLEHVATGLFVYGAYAKEYIDTTGNIKPEGDMWYIKAGIRQRWLPLGHTVLYGEYGNDDDKFTQAMSAAGVTSSELDRYGIGVVQEIDAAAMSVWLAWRHYEPDATCNAAGCLGGGVGVVGANNLEEFDLIKAGALINF
ncbi:MAG: porin [Alphaproteobacteria bacterium]|nr:porin [Alphaproteobacteria bacterium]